MAPRGEWLAPSQVPVLGRGRAVLVREDGSPPGRVDAPELLVHLCEANRVEGEHDRSEEAQDAQGARDQRLVFDRPHCPLAEGQHSCLEDREEERAGCQ